MPVFLHDQRDLMDLFFFVNGVLGLYNKDLDLNLMTTGPPMMQDLGGRYLRIAFVD